MDPHPLRVLSLFSGIGGLDAGVRAACPAARTKVYVERDLYCTAVLAARMADGSLDAAPVWDSAESFPAGRFHGLIDCVIGGPPCQPISIAGRRKGAADDRWMWGITLDIVAATAPAVVFFENPANFLQEGAEGVIARLSDLGFRTAAEVVTAAEVGAPHGRERVFIMGHSNSGGRLLDGSTQGQQSSNGEDDRVPVPAGGAVGTSVRRTDRGAVADTESRGRAEQSRSHDAEGAVGSAVAGAGGRTLHGTTAEGVRGRDRVEPGRPSYLPAFPPPPGDLPAWLAIAARRPGLLPATETQSAVRPVAPGLPGILARPLRRQELHALGNACIPAQATLAWTMLWRQLAAKAPRSQD